MVMAQLTVDGDGHGLVEVGSILADEARHTAEWELGDVLRVLWLDLDKVDVEGVGLGHGQEGGGAGVAGEGVEGTDCVVS